MIANMAMAIKSEWKSDASPSPWKVKDQPVGETAFAVWRPGEERPEENDKVFDENKRDGYHARKSVRKLWTSLGFERKGYITANEYQVLVKELIKAQMPASDAHKIDIPGLNHSFRFQGKDFDEAKLEQMAVDAMEIDMADTGSMQFEEFFRKMIDFFGRWGSKWQFYQSYVVAFFDKSLATIKERSDKHSWINKAVGPGTRGDPSKLPKYGPYTYKPGAPRPKQNVHGEDLHPAMFMRMSLMGYHVSEPMLEVYKAAGQKAVEKRERQIKIRKGLLPSSSGPVANSPHHGRGARGAHFRRPSRQLVRASFPPADGSVPVSSPSSRVITQRRGASDDHHHEDEIIMDEMDDAAQYYQRQAALAHHPDASHPRSKTRSPPSLTIPPSSTEWLDRRAELASPSPGAEPEPLFSYGVPSPYPPDFDPDPNAAMMDAHVAPAPSPSSRPARGRHPARAMAAGMHRSSPPASRSLSAVSHAGPDEDAAEAATAFVSRRTEHPGRASPHVRVVTTHRDGQEPGQPWMQLRPQEPCLVRGEEGGAGRGGDDAGPPRFSAQVPSLDLNGALGATSCALEAVRARAVHGILSSPREHVLAPQQQSSQSSYAKDSFAYHKARPLSTRPSTKRAPFKPTNSASSQPPPNQPSGSTSSPSRSEHRSLRVPGREAHLSGDDNDAHTSPAPPWAELLTVMKTMDKEGTIPPFYEQSFDDLIPGGERSRTPQQPNDARSSGGVGRPRREHTASLGRFRDVHDWSHVDHSPRRNNRAPPPYVTRSAMDFTAHKRRAFSARSSFEPSNRLRTSGYRPRNRDAKWFASRSGPVGSYYPWNASSSLPPPRGTPSYNDLHTAFLAHGPGWIPGVPREPAHPSWHEGHDAIGYRAVGSAYVSSPVSGPHETRITANNGEAATWEDHGRRPRAEPQASRAATIISHVDPPSSDDESVVVQPAVYPPAAQRTKKVSMVSYLDKDADSSGEPSVRGSFTRENAMPGVINRSRERNRGSEHHSAMSDSSTPRGPIGPQAPPVLSVEGTPVHAVAVGTKTSASDSAQHRKREHAKAGSLVVPLVGRGPGGYSGGSGSHGRYSSLPSSSQPALRPQTATRQIPGIQVTTPRRVDARVHVNFL